MLILFYEYLDLYWQITYCMSSNDYLKILLGM